ncbi:MAG: type II toxin-antitoxin system HicA family toxin [Acidobacteriota bacterium]|jgi:mRNA interferase HicA|nr:type II toxin-antitoxin system HicA family toxin [Acidobacteriota bacterium]
MKRKELIRLFTKKGWRLDREGGKHSILTNGKDEEAIPQHREVDEGLAKDLIRKWKLK